MKKIVNIAAYKFVSPPDLHSLRTRLLALCRSWELKGTILLSAEGINLFVAGSREKIDLLLAELRGIPGLEDLQLKVSETEHQPFTRMLVRVKKEIIAFGVEGIDPSKHTSPKLAATELKQWLDEGRPVTLLDTRNDYEVKLGTFKNARAIGIDHFREFPDAVRKLPPELKEQPIVMFCTGGIRCEKAGPFMEREGFKNIFQLDGGILKYFEQCGGAHYDGECFVFDQRVGLDPSLQETESTQCFRCLTPLTEADQKDERYISGQSCPYCFKSPAEQMALNIAQRYEAIRRAITPLPGSVSRDNFKPVNVPKDCDGKTLLQTLCRIVAHVPASYWEAECARGMLREFETRSDFGHANRSRGRTLSAQISRRDRAGRERARGNFARGRGVDRAEQTRAAADPSRWAVLSQHAPAHSQRSLSSAKTASGAPLGREHDGHFARHAHATFRREIAAAICEGTNRKNFISFACKASRRKMFSVAPRPSAPSRANWVHAKLILKMALKHARSFACCGKIPTARRCSKRGR